jgi:prevent-host-death family protein
MLIVPLFEARNNLPQLVNQAEAGEIIQVTRHGKPAAMLIGHSLYEHLLASAGGIGARLEAWTLLCAESGMEDPMETAFEGLRSADTGRPVDLD